jgi:hypothetical protein
MTVPDPTSQIIIDNGIFGEMGGYEGSAEDLDSDKESEWIRFLNKHRDENKLDSLTVPSYSAYSKNGVLTIVLIGDAGIGTDWYPSKEKGEERVGRRTEEIERLTDEGLGKSGGKKEKRKPAEKKFGPLSLIKEESSMQKAETAAYKNKEDQKLKSKERTDELVFLEAKKKVQISTYKEMKELDFEDEMALAKTEIETINKQIRELK